MAGHHRLETMAILVALAAFCGAAQAAYVACVAREDHAAEIKLKTAP